jgi:hypothetical protein
MGCVIPHQSNVGNIPHQTNAGLIGHELNKLYVASTALPRTNVSPKASLTIREPGRVNNLRCQSHENWSRHSHYSTPTANTSFLSLSGHGRLPAWIINLILQITDYPWFIRVSMCVTTDKWNDVPVFNWAVIFSSIPHPKSPVVPPTSHASTGTNTIRLQIMTNQSIRKPPTRYNCCVQCAPIWHGHYEQDTAILP